jgi:hypothetical protein
MRMPCVQFTIRGTMLAVAAVAVVLWSAQTASRWRVYRERAQYHASEHARLRAELLPDLVVERRYGFVPGCGLMRAWFETRFERAEGHARLKSRYQRAAFHPWLPVEPDPPEPK